MRTLVIYPQQQRLVTVPRAVEEECRDVFNSNGEVYENACDLPPAAETVATVTRAVEEESRDVFNSNGEVYENACDLPPAAETVVTVTRAVEEESRDVFNSNGEVYECLWFTPSSRDCGDSDTGCRGGEQVCGVTWLVTYSCSVFCELSINFLIFQNVQCIPCFFIYVMVFIIAALIICLFQEVHYVLIQ